MAGAVFTPAQRAACWERSGGYCEVCGCRLREKGWNLHHREGRGMGGRGKKRPRVTCADGLVVCGMGNTSGCHRLMDEQRPWAEARGYVVRRGHALGPANVPVLLRGAWTFLLRDGGLEPVQLPELLATLDERLAA